MPKFRKTNDIIPRNAWTDKRRKDEQTLFYRIFPATAGGPKKTQEPRHYVNYFNCLYDLISFESLLYKAWLQG